MKQIKKVSKLKGRGGQSSPPKDNVNKLIKVASSLIRNNKFS